MYITSAISEKEEKEVSKSDKQEVIKIYPYLSYDWLKFQYLRDNLIKGV